MQNHVILACPFGHRLDRGIADHQVNHDDDGAKRLGKFSALVHVFHGTGGDVQVMALDFTRRGGSLVDRFHTVKETVTPVHEGLRIDILIVFHEVQAALEAFVHNASVIAAGEAQFRFGCCAQQGPAEFVETFALHHDAGGGALESFQISDGNAHVFQTQRFHGLETKYIADDRSGQVGDGTRLEQIQIIGDIGKILGFVLRARTRIWYQFRAIGLGTVEFAGGQPIGPYHGPGRGGRFTGYSSGGFLMIYPFLGCNTEQGNNIGILRNIVRIPIPHFLVRNYAGLVALLAFYFLAHVVLLVTVDKGETGKIVNRIIINTSHMF